eukprot:m.127794 g.127794  ORF g.127794 m.127794 type:complete len:265 (-) comp15807_c0_seq2:2179-2973(-)
MADQRSTAKKKNKKKSKNPSTPTAAASDTEPPVPFEACLDWCIAQIDCGYKLRAGAKPAAVLKFLTSSKHPKIKKIAMMKQAFGDYRKLMKQLGPPTHPGAKSIKVTKTTRKTKTSDGVFFRLSAAQSRGQSASDLKRRQERRRLLTKGAASEDTAAADQPPKWSMQADTTTPFQFGFGESTSSTPKDQPNHLQTIAAELRSRRAGTTRAAGGQFQFNFADTATEETDDGTQELAADFEAKASLQATAVSETVEFKFNFGDSPQ